MMELQELNWFGWYTILRAGCCQSVSNANEIVSRQLSYILQFMVWYHATPTQSAGGNEDDPMTCEQLRVIT